MSSILVDHREQLEHRLRTALLKKDKELNQALPEEQEEALQHYLESGTSFQLSGRVQATVRRIRREVGLMASALIPAPEFPTDLHIQQWVHEQYGFVLTPAQRSTVSLCQKYQYKFKQIDCKKAVSGEVLRCMLGESNFQNGNLDQYYYALL
jgi:hypothetical protein